MLGVPQNASPEQIRKAYVTLAKTYHPDRYATAELPPEGPGVPVHDGTPYQRGTPALENVRKAQANAAASQAAPRPHTASQAH